MNLWPVAEKKIGKTSQKVSKFYENDCSFKAFDLNNYGKFIITELLRNICLTNAETIKERLKQPDRQTDRLTDR